jgi:hypothetical protein
MIGNLKVYQGPEAFNHYAEGLRAFGDPFFGTNSCSGWIRTRPARRRAHPHLSPRSS